MSNANGGTRYAITKEISWTTADQPESVTPPLFNRGMSWIDAAQLPAGDRMTPIAAGINRGYAEFCELLSEADRGQEWLADGSPTIVPWMAARFGIEESFGRRLARLAQRLEDLPELRKRFGAGELSLDAVELLSEVARPETEHALIEDALGRDLHDVGRIVSRAKPPTIEQSADDRATEWVSTQWNLHHRRMRVGGQLAGVGAQYVEDRLVEGAKRIPRNPETGQYDDWNKRMADSLVETCATSSGELPTPTMVVHTELEALRDGEGISEISGGPVISNEIARMLGCDAEVEAVVERDGKPIGIGRKSRRIPGWLRRQVENRDHHCQFPGCGRTAFLQIHHIEHWADGGRTDFDSLVLLCWWHHIFIHEKGWHITCGPGDGFRFRRPDWTPYPPPIVRRT